MHPERGYDEAQKIFERMFNEAKGYQQPYINQGQEQYGNLMGAQNELLNPQNLLSKWMSGYEESPYAKKSFENARSGGLDAASSMGLLGSSSALNNIQNSASDIMNKDRQSYLQDLMQKYLSGIGVGQNIYNTGAGAASSLGTLAHGFGQDIGGARYGAINAPGNLLGNLLKTGASIYAGRNGGGAGAASSIAA